MTKEVALTEQDVRQLMFSAAELERWDDLLHLSKQYITAMNRGPICFVGNGPSLTVEKVEHMGNLMPTIGCNRIHLIYPQTEWRPSLYVYTDRYANPQWGAELVQHLQQYLCFVRADIAYALSRWWQYPNLRVIGECHLRPLGNNLPKEVTEPWEQLDHPWHYHQHSSICTYGGALNTAAQLAWLMGHSEFHMIGCDGVYKAHSVNHFDPSYADDRGGEEYDDRITGYVNRRLSHVHELVVDELENKRGVKVIKH